jgi:hypothetical protein
MKNEIIPHNTDKDGCASCIKANYYKMGGANFLKHSHDGRKATCIIEIYEDRQDDLLEQQGGGGYNQAYKIESTM